MKIESAKSSIQHKSVIQANDGIVRQRMDYEKQKLRLPDGAAISENEEALLSVAGLMWLCKGVASMHILTRDFDPLR